jgi:hypothetical protein
MQAICNSVFKMRKTIISRASTNALADVLSVLERALEATREIGQVILR